MEDVNVSNDLRQLSHGQVKALEYSRYDINGYHFRMVKLEASHPLVAITSSGVVTSDDDATGHVTDYYGIVQNIVEYTFGGAKVLRVVFFFNVIGLIQSTTLEWVILIWWRSSMNRAIQTADFCLHIRRNRCTT
jgi:hypothetical protein